MKVEISKRNIITNVEQWHQFAPPKDSDKHWKEGRSAMSLAQFMTNSKQIKKLEDLLKEWGYDTSGTIKCTPEANTNLPGTGGGRNHDLLMVGKDFVVGIEAKVTETFGNPISMELFGAIENKSLRINTLAKDLLGCGVNEKNEHLRYQLLTGIMGTFYEAKSKSKPKALFLVIVFTDAITSKDYKVVQNNNKDFEEFCKYLGLTSDGGEIERDGIKLDIKKIEISLAD